LAQALSAALLHFIWQGSLVAVVLWAALWAMRRRPASWRYAASCGALALLAALPAATVWILMRGARMAEPLHVPVYFFAVAQPMAVDASRAASWVSWAEGWALPVWSLGVLCLSIRLAWGAGQLYRLRRRGQAASEAVQAAVSRLAARMGIRRAVAVWTSALADGPAAVGWLRPVILLPSATLLGLTTEQLEAVLAHELAHIRRFDYAVNLAQMVIETLLFYHPAVWWVSARIRHERELCCDDLAVESCGNALCYARALTRLERLRLAAPGMAMGATGGPLLYRVQRLMGVAGAEYRTSRLPAILVVCVGIGCLALNVHWAKAQDQAPAKPLATQPQSPRYFFSGRISGDASGVQVDSGGAAVLEREPVEYPSAAVEKHIEGTVTVEAILDADGAVTDAHVLAGPTELRKAALESVLEWRFQPDPAGAGAARQVNLTFQIPPGGFPQEPGPDRTVVLVNPEGAQGAALRRSEQTLGFLEEQLAEFHRQHQGDLASSPELKLQEQQLVVKLKAAKDAVALAQSQTEREQSLRELKLAAEQRSADAASLMAWAKAAEQSRLTMELENQLKEIKQRHENQGPDGASPQLEAQYQAYLERLESARAAQKRADEEATQGDQADLTPALGRVVKAVRIRGLSEATAAELQAQLPIHVGDTLTARAMKQVAEVVQQFHEQLAMGYALAEDGQVEIRIANIGNGNVGLAVRK